MARPDRAKAIHLLKKAKKEVDDWRYRGTDSAEFKRWYKILKVNCSNIFGEKSTHFSEFEDELYNEFGVLSNDPDLARALLDAMINEVENWWSDAEQRPTSSATSVRGRKSPDSNKIFIVHGRDDGSRETVARFLERLKLEPVILNEEASRGKTIIEKFEHHADVGFAVVLLTPDDEGALRGDEDDRSPRARQNVIFELGFFIGHLGRERVCALTKGSDMEIPSDYAGVVYIPLDDKGAWKIGLVKELKAAGFDVDANRAFVEP